MKTRKGLLGFLLTTPLLLAGVSACGVDDGSGDSDTGSSPGGGKLDDPTDAPEYCAEVACADRLADAMSRGFLNENFIRWQCADVSGVTGPGGSEAIDCEALTEGVRKGEFDTAVSCFENPRCTIDDVSAWNAGDFESTSCIAIAEADDRGQEYCEYFAIIDAEEIAPEADEDEAFTDTLVLGRTTDRENGAPYAFDFDQLSDEQLEWLEDEEDPEHVVGSCMFTSWHWDITEPSRGEEPLDVHGVDVNYDNFRMFGRFNNNGAARQLVLDGLTKIHKGLQGRREQGQPAAEHPYWGACMGMTDVGAGVEWRVSDPSVGTVGAVLTECGCFADTPGGRITDAATIAAAVIPKNGIYGDGSFLRGFRLGTWSDENDLPAGCHYVEHDANGDAPDTHTLVACDITAEDLSNTSNAEEMKDYCRTKYGDDVVIHVPLPGDIIKCEPPEGAPAYCNEEAPWALDSLPENIALQTDDIPEGSVCQVSEGRDTTDRGGRKIDDQNSPAAQ